MADRTAQGLTEVDAAILSLADSAPSAGEMANRIAELGVTEIGYYQKLNALLDTEAALAAYPVTVNRLRRQRAGSRRWHTRNGGNR